MENESSSNEYEVVYPQQCEEYKKITREKYQLFLDKGREYSVNNVKAIGLIGLSLRLMEKIIRILNLQGFDPFEGKFVKEISDPKFGNVEREMEDVVNLAIIAIIVARGKWAK